MSRRFLIAGNWKMNLGGRGACELAAEIAKGAADLPTVDVVVAPPFTAIAAVSAELDGSTVQVGGQNLHASPGGAFTGEINGSMLAECGATWVILGHSERRQLFGETDASIAKKLEAALAAGLSPIVCVGETLEERSSGRTLDVVLSQLDSALPGLAAAGDAAAVAYEPVWAIGTGLNATPDQAEEVHAAIRARIAADHPELASSMRILYGGSVKADNAGTLLSCPNVDGALVGGASLVAKQFLAIVGAAGQVAPAKDRC